MFKRDDLPSGMDAITSDADTWVKAAKEIKARGIPPPVVWVYADPNESCACTRTRTRAGGEASAGTPLKGFGALDVAALSINLSPSPSSTPSLFSQAFSIQS